MARVRVTPVIGLVSRDRLDSMRGTHAIHERAVLKQCTSETVGDAVTEAIREIIMMDVQSKCFKANQLQVLIQFEL